LNELTVIGYCRVSSKEQSVEGVSLPAQRAQIEAWCEATGAVLIDVVEDDAVSGSRPLIDRPGGVRIARLFQSRKPEAEAVAVTRLDRVGRDAAETLAYLRHFAEGRVGLVSLREHLDLASPQGKAMAGVSAIFGQLERELIGERTAEALGRLRDEGKVFGAIPYGWVRSGDHLVPDTDEQRVTREIVELRESRCSFREIAAWLNGEGIKAKKGGNWSPMSVRSVCLGAIRRNELEV
jgi:DNA invertase Pin-like site-specific DNA recombinase